MANFSTYIQEQFTSWLKAGTFATAPTSLICALSTADPLDDASGIAEPVAMGYSRETVDLGAASSVNGVGTTVTGPSAAVVFGPATGDWGSIAYWALYENAGTNMLFHGSVTAAKTVVSGDSFVVNANSLSIIIR
jgi:hypothetical protein